MQESFTPIVIDKIGSLYAKGPVEKTPDDMSPEVRNCKFVGSSVRMRFGLNVTAQSQDAARITGFLPAVLDGTRYLLSYNSNGRFEYEANEGAGNMATVVGGSGFDVGTYSDMAQAYNRAFATLTNLNTPNNSPISIFKSAGTPSARFIGFPNNATPIASATTSAATGDVNTGVRYFVVLFETNTGYISGFTDPARFEANLVTANRKVDLTGVPTGTPEIVRRWIAITEAGAPSSGPYYYIPSDIVSPELNADITATVINDNVATTVTLNFTDDALVGGVDVTSYPDKITLDPQNSVFFSPTTRRMFWAGETANPTLFRVSGVDDPETYFGTTGFIQLGTNDGDAAIGGTEWRGEIYLLKKNSGYIVSPTNDEPSVWPTTRRWVGSGPSGPWAFATSDEFMAYASLTGLHIYDGSAPRSITTMTMKDVWDRINWKYGHLVWVLIDTNEDEIHVGLPLDYSSVPNTRLTVYYGDGWDKLKWSFDDIYAHKAVTAMRELPASPSPTPTDARIASSQVLLAAADPTGAINMLDPTAISDNGQPINQVWRSAYVAPRKIGIYTLGGVDIMASGQGIVAAQVYKFNNQSPVTLRQLTLSQTDLDHSLKTAIDSERFSIRVTNGNMADSAFNLARITAYMKYKWAVRTL